jgi:hypothetical protein|tara:strand:+ start:3063 stop:3344 length:282 start_codon:yes stop_codon:yes gene_type:complete
MDNKVTGIMKMKKEWIYSIIGAVLGAGLIATMIFFATSKDTSADCVAVAKYITTGEGYLTNHEKQMADYMKKDRSWQYMSAYVTCLHIEEGRI